MPPYRFGHLLLAALAAAVPAFPKGILVRFLAAPGDSAARYDVYRQTAANSAQRIGSANAGGTDTVAFPDTGAKPGAAYRYSMRSVDSAGLESDPSDTTLAAIPLLALPDTLRASSWPVSWTLPVSAHPLRGAASLALELSQPSSQPPSQPAPSGPPPAVAIVALAYDTAAGRIEFRLISGRADTLRIALLGSYFGKFADADTAVIVTAGAPVSLSLPREAAAGAMVPAAFGRARSADGRGLPVLVTGRGGTRLLYDAAGRNAGTR